jgi:hypothetical protein
LCVVWAIVSRFFDFPDLFSFPRRESLALSIGLGGIGVTFVWLRLRGSIKFAGE